MGMPLLFHNANVRGVKKGRLSEYECQGAVGLLYAMLSIFGETKMASRSYQGEIPSPMSNRTESAATCLSQDDAV